MCICIFRKLTQIKKQGKLAIKTKKALTLWHNNPKSSFSEFRKDKRRPQQGR